MTIVNLEGFTVFGSGSEWFWICAQFIALAATGIAIYRQLRAQGYANQLVGWTRLADQWSSIPFIRSRLTALMEVSEGKPGISASQRRVGDWLDSLAGTQYKGYLRPRIAREEWGRIVRVWWAILAPRATDTRASEPLLWRDLERWATELGERDARSESPELLDAAAVSREIALSIAYYIERLRTEQETARGTVPVWPIPEAAATSRTEATADA